MPFTPSMACPWPAPLQPGDRVRLVAASSALSELSQDRLEAGVALLRHWGLRLRCL
jgi:muramoyltetrapeptide carboxypeptidase